jgi:hypothetical protein
VNQRRLRSGAEVSQRLERLRLRIESSLYKVVQDGFLGSLVRRLRDFGPGVLTTSRIGQARATARLHGHDQPSAVLWRSVPHSIQSGAGNDTGSGGDEQNTATRPDLPVRTI